VALWRKQSRITGHTDRVSRKLFPYFFWDQTSGKLIFSRPDEKNPTSRRWTIWTSDVRSLDVRHPMWPDRTTPCPITLDFNLTYNVRSDVETSAQKKPSKKKGFEGHTIRGASSPTPGARLAPGLMPLSLLRVQASHPMHHCNLRHPMHHCHPLLHYSAGTW